MIIKSVIEDAARYLSDYSVDAQYIHWSEDDLLSYAKLAIGIIAKLNKNAFTRTSVIDLKEGSLQTLPDDMNELVAIHGQVVDGTVVPKTRMVDIRKYPSLGRPVCNTTSKGDYNLISYSYYQDDRKTFYVNPPVEKGQEAQLQVSYYSPPDVTSVDADIQLDDEYIPVLFELILYYAWGVDIEDSATRERSVTHWNNAMTLLKLHIPYKTPNFNEVER